MYLNILPDAVMRIWNSVFYVYIIDLRVLQQYKNVPYTNRRIFNFNVANMRL